MSQKNTDNYETISLKIKAIKEKYKSLKNTTDNFAFNALVVKSLYFKSPSYELTDKDLADIIVDGQADGGVDILLSDPDSETSDLIIGQAKYYRKIDIDECKDTINKMADFYLDMSHGHYENVNEKVQQRYLALEGDVGDESKIKFVLYTSAPQKKIDIKILTEVLYSKLPDRNKYEIRVLFDADIVEEILEAESRKKSIEKGKIVIDEAKNWLYYDEMAAMVNVSAYSIKKLYGLHNINLLSRNLRYHVNYGTVDKDIEFSINNDPEYFWLKNNGITIICDDFKLDGKEVKLTNFSIINGGQTTLKIAKNKKIDDKYDLYLPCKIVKAIGDDEEKKNDFILEIAKAANSQKPIKPSDLKANALEQILFCNAMKDIGVYYRTKRGEEIPNAYKEKTKYSDISEIGKLCLSGIFQMPCTSRNKPSTFYTENYYKTIFEGNRQQIAKLCKELLYIDNYFRKTFLSAYTKSLGDDPNKEVKTQFANNARTACTAFVMLASRYHQNNLTNNKLTTIFQEAKRDNLSDMAVFNIVNDLTGVSWVLPPNAFDNKDKYDKGLYALFSLFIQHGAHNLMILQEKDDSITASNYLKKDKSYMDILRMNWDAISTKIHEIFSSLIQNQ